MELRRINFDQK